MITRLSDEQLHDPAPVLEIEARRRFIGQQESRPIDEGSGNGDALPFAARQVLRQLIEAMTQTEDVEQVERVLFRFAFGLDELELFSNRQIWNEVGLLKYEADFIQAKQASFFFTRSEQLPSLELDEPNVRSFQ